MRPFVSLVATLCASLVIAHSYAQSSDEGYAEAEISFNNAFQPAARQLVQVYLIAGGYSNFIPVDHFTLRLFRSLKKFEAENGFDQDGQLSNKQYVRLGEIAEAKFDLWGLHKVVLPNHDAAVWVPFGLGLDAKTTDKGLHYTDSRGRFALMLVSLPDVSVRASFDDLITKYTKDESTINYKVVKSDWFALSVTTADGDNHYFRYHQDGSSLTGFKMDWNVLAGDINAERIAVLDSAVLAASTNGVAFIDPPENFPRRAELAREASPEQQPTPQVDGATPPVADARPAAPQPAVEPPPPSAQPEQRPAAQIATAQVAVPPSLASPTSRATRICAEYRANASACSGSIATIIYKKRYLFSDEKKRIFRFTNTCESNVIVIWSKNFVTRSLARNENAFMTCNSSGCDDDQQPVICEGSAQ